MKRYGIEWKGGNGEWTGSSGRFHIVIWPFGSIHQCKVIVEYPYTVGRHLVSENKSVGICLPSSKTRDEAMKRGIAWMKEYVENGPRGPEEVFRDSYENWKTLYQRRWQVLNHLFYVIGNGYDWLDGCIVSNAPYGHLEMQDRPDPLMERMDALDEKYEEMRKKYPDLPELPYTRRKQKTVGPHPDDGRKLRFYPVTSDYSNICNVPLDVTDEWLQVTYEAALMLRDRADVEQDRQLGNHHMGVKLVKELEGKFGNRIQRVQTYQELVEAQTSASLPASSTP